MGHVSSLRTLGCSFGVSAGIHLVLLGFLVTSFAPPRRASLMVQRVRLVYVDPAPARGTAARTAPVAAPAVPVAPPPVAPKPAPVAAVPKPIPVPKLVRSTKTVEAEPVPPAGPAAETPASTAPVVDAPAPASESALGSAAGVEGGHGLGSGTATGVRRLGDVATAPVLVTRVMPEYPRSARLAGIEGEVVLEVIVDRHGRVTSTVRVVTSVPELERAAVAAVQRWRFRPARDRQGEAVAVLMEVPMRFVLHEATADASR